METPNQTLYINNINEKIKKDVLKKMLYMVFSQYGKVDEVVCCKGVKLRGQVCKIPFIWITFIYKFKICCQAWVVFQDPNSAANALRGKQGFTFYDKPLVRISFTIFLYC